MNLYIFFIKFISLNVQCDTTMGKNFLEDTNKAHKKSSNNDEKEKNNLIERKDDKEKKKNERE